MSSPASTQLAFPGEPVAPGLQVPPLGLRLGARALDGLIGMVGIVVLALLLAVLGLAPFEALLGAYVAWGVVAVVTQLTASATPGQLVLGLLNVVPATGERSGGRTLGKYLLIGLASSLTCGLLPLIALMALDQPLRRSWFDRAAGLVVVRRAPVMPSSSPAVPSPIRTVGSTPAAESTTVAPSNQPPPVLPVPMAAPPATRLRLRLDTGQVLNLDRSYVLGRDPVAPVAAPHAMPIAVSDDARSISKTHVLIESDGHLVQVHDLHSTNGVTLTEPGRGTVSLAAGDPTPAAPGSTIGYGDRTAEVLE